MKMSFLLRRVMESSVALLFLMLSLGSVADANTPRLKILFIGNSFTQVGNLPKLVAEMAANAGWPQPEVHRATKVSKTLGWHLENPATLKAIQRGDWDVVVLQGYSTRPLDTPDVEEADPAGFKADMLALYDLVTASQPGTRVLLFETWPRHATHSIYQHPQLPDPETMQAKVTAAYEGVRDALLDQHADANVDIAPVGQAWVLNLHGKDLHLYHPDRYHANDLGRYLAASVIYSKIYQRSPVGRVALGEVTQHEAEYLQHTAEQATGITTPGGPDGQPRSDGLINTSFESPAHERDGGFSDRVLDGWFSRDSRTNGISSVNSDDARFAGTSNRGGAEGDLPAPAQGKQYLYINSGYAYQSPVGQLQRGERIQLTVAVGRTLRESDPDTAYAIQLCAGDTVLEEHTGDTALLEAGAFTDVTLVHDAVASEHAGKTLRVVLSRPGENTLNRLAFDNIRLQSGKAAHSRPNGSQPQRTSQASAAPTQSKSDVQAKQIAQSPHAAATTIAMPGPAAPIVSMGGARLERSELFGDHAVLQAGTSVPVWGWASPGAQVNVRFDAQSVTAVTDDQGRWTATLDNLQAGTSGTLDISSKGEKTLRSEDVLVGEVWMCAGQSNMEGYVFRLRDGESLMAAADLPELRLFKIEKEATPQPTERVRGEWIVCQPGKIGLFSGIGFLVGRDLQQTLGVPVGMIQATWGGTRVKGWTPKQVMLNDSTYIPLIEEEASIPEAAKPVSFEAMKAQTEAHKADQQGVVKPTKIEWLPGRIYNGMIHPAIPYALRGVLWYQGESDAYQPDTYRTLFPAMIRSWRSQWQRPDLPFIFVQLPGYKDTVPEPPATSFWAQLREAQTQALQLDETHMVVTVDIGEADIHPKNKHEVARRLLNKTLAVVYGKDLPHEGPRLKQTAFKDNAVVLQFEATGDLQAPPGTLDRAFAIGDGNGPLYWGQASLAGQTVTIKSDHVSQPKVIRYNFSEQPEGRLTDATLLPAAPFRSDAPAN